MNEIRLTLISTLMTALKHFPLARYDMREIEKIKS